jgi:transcriptional regulator with XRE-family HTH domain
MLPRKTAESISKILAKEITAKRVALGLSKNETATRAGLAVSFVSDLESGKSRASVETLVKLAWVFGTSASELLAICEKEAGYSSSSRREDETPQG